MSVKPCGLLDAQIDNGRGDGCYTCVVVWTVVQCGREILWKAREPWSLRPVRQISSCIINQGCRYMRVGGRRRFEQVHRTLTWACRSSESHSDCNGASHRRIPFPPYPRTW